MTEIILNGAVHQLNETQSIADLVATLTMSQQTIAVAVNRQIIGRNDWATFQLKAQDQVDVVHAIGGG